MNYSQEEIYKELVKIAKGIEDKVTQFLDEESSKGYIKPFENKYKQEDADDESITLKIGSRRFILIANIIPQTARIYYKTYELTRDNATYPKWLMSHIPELDIFTDIDGISRFTEVKEYETLAAFGLSNKMKTDLLRDFAKDYTHQLSRYIDKQPPETPGN